MANEIIKRTFFGGFKREDVINYIESLQMELVEAQRRADSAEQAAEKAKRQCVQYTRLAEELEQEKEKSAALEAERDAAAAKAEEYLTMVGECDRQLAEMEEKLKALEESCADISDSEKQINGLVLDAVMYSDKITCKAKDAALAVSRDTQDTINATAQDIETIGSEIGRISLDFSDTVSRLSVKLGVLTKSISQLNSGLESDVPEEDDGQFHLGEDGLLFLDEIYLQRMKQIEQERNHGGIQD